MSGTGCDRRATTIGTCIGSLAACSGGVSVGGGAVSQSDLEGLISSELEALFGVAPDDVTCPDGIDAEVDATQRCTLLDGDTEYGVDAVVTEIVDDQASVAIEVDDVPLDG